MLSALSSVSSIDNGFMVSPYNSCGIDITFAVSRSCLVKGLVNVLLDSLPTISYKTLVSVYDIIASDEVGTPFI